MKTGMYKALLGATAIYSLVLTAGTVNAMSLTEAVSKLFIPIQKLVKLLPIAKGFNLNLSKAKVSSARVLI